MQSPFGAIQGITGMSHANQMNQMSQMNQVGVTNSVSHISTGAVSSLAPTQENATSFSNMLGNALTNVNTTMEEAKSCTDGLLNGNLDNLHDMSIAGAKSEVMLHLTTQIASKLCSSATTLFQMQL